MIYFLVLQQEDNRLKASLRNMANRNSFGSFTKRGNSGLRVTRADEMGVQVTKKDLADGIATSVTQNQKENNVDLRKRRDDSNESYQPPSSRHHMLRVRKSYPRFRQGMKLRVTRDEEKPLRGYFARI